MKFSFGVLRPTYIVALSTVLPAARNPAAAQALKPQPQVIKLTVSPAPAPRGALRIRLLPEYLDRKPGNRAALYYRAMVFAQQAPKEAVREFERDRDRWLELPLEKLPRAQVHERLRTYRNALIEVEAGVWREQCDWGFRIREMTGTTPLLLLLPDVQETRQLARALSLRCRLELAEDRLKDAQKTLQTMFQLSRDVAQTPTLVNALVGMAIVAMTAGDLQQFVQIPEAPNLYWALTALPRPLVDLREAAEQERAIPLQLIPILRDVEKPRNAEQWRVELLAAIRDFFEVAELQPKLSSTQVQLALTAVMLRGYPMAKRALIEQGRDLKEVEAMPVAQVVALHLLDSYHYAWGEVFKCFYLPYPESALEYQKVEKRLQREAYLVPAGRSREVIPLAGLLLPAVGGVIHAEARTERYIAELRCIEALRMHAAEHGQWPKSLSEITVVPVPDDPVTGRPFVYRLEGQTAVLDCIAPAYYPVHNARRIELTLRK